MCPCKRIFLPPLAGLRHMSNLAYLLFSHKLTVSQLLHDTIWVRCNEQSHVLTTWQLHEELMNAILQPLP